MLFPVTVVVAKVDFVVIGGFVGQLSSSSFSGQLTVPSQICLNDDIIHRN